jgi:hypothetical protein
MGGQWKTKHCKYNENKPFWKIIISIHPHNIFSCLKKMSEDEEAM